MQRSDIDVVIELIGSIDTAKAHHAQPRKGQTVCRQNAREGESLFGQRRHSAL
ncbi:MAG: hypothetical protein ACLSHC_07955 [Bilophila wadsworthia]